MWLTTLVTFKEMAGGMRAVFCMLRRAWACHETALKAAFRWMGWHASVAGTDLIHLKPSEHSAKHRYS